MKLHSLLPSWLSAALPAILVSSIFSAASADAAAAPKVFRFTASAGNTNTSVMTMDHPALNGKPTLRPVITQYSTGVTNPHPVGLIYNHLFQRWQVLNEDNQNIPANVNFNVALIPTTKAVGVAPANLDGNLAFFTIQKNNPQAQLIATHVANPYAALSPVIQPNHVGLFFIPAGSRAPISSSRWSIFPENGKSQVAATYNIADVSKIKVANSLISFRHTAVTANTTAGETVITNALTDGKPNAVLFIQHVFSEAAAKNVDEALGVRYADGKWRIFVQDGSDLPVTSEYVVAAFPAVSP